MVYVFFIQYKRSTLFTDAKIGNISTKKKVHAVVVHTLYTLDENERGNTLYRYMYPLRLFLLVVCSAIVVLLLLPLGAHQVNIIKIYSAYQNYCYCYRSMTFHCCPLPELLFLLLFSFHCYRRCVIHFYFFMGNNRIDFHSRIHTEVLIS